MFFSFHYFSKLSTLNHCRSLEKTRPTNLFQKNSTNGTSPVGNHIRMILTITTHSLVLSHNEQYFGCVDLSEPLKSVRKEKKKKKCKANRDHLSLRQHDSFNISASGPNPSIKENVAIGRWNTYHLKNRCLKKKCSNNDDKTRDHCKYLSHCESTPPPPPQLNINPNFLLVDYCWF